MVLLGHKGLNMILPGKKNLKHGIIRSKEHNIMK